MRFGRGDHFPTFAIVPKIVGARIQRDGHELVFTGLVLLDEDLTLALEHPGNTAELAQVATVLAKDVTDLAHGAIPIVGGDLHQDGRATWSITFEHDFVDLTTFEFAGA